MPLRGPPDERDPDDLLTFGVVNVDKPPGPTSHQVSTWVRSLADVDRAGHAGTLDPAVTGSLPVLLGNATRLAGVLSMGKKTYVTVLELHDDPPANWEQIMDRFEGQIFQRPPRKSAVARTLRVRHVYGIDVLERDERRLLCRIECEAGTYIRKLCHDMGLAIGTGAHMVALRRVESEPFDDTTLTTMHDLADALAWWRDDASTDSIRRVVLPAEMAVTHLPSVIIQPTAAKNVATGAPIYEVGIVDASVDDIGSLVACYTPDGSLVCLGRRTDPEAADGVGVDLERVLV